MDPDLVNLKPDPQPCFPLIVLVVSRFGFSRTPDLDSDLVNLRPDPQPFFTINCFGCIQTRIFSQAGFRSGSGQSKTGSRPGFSRTPDLDPDLANLKPDPQPCSPLIVWAREKVTWCHNNTGALDPPGLIKNKV